jgi:release factor glutamine methyltransferase
MTNISEALRHGTRLLAQTGSEEANLEAELLLAHTLNTDRTHLYQRLRDALPDDDANAFEALLQRRLAHEPTAYILGHKEFYGLDFYVTPAAIIPRPETETLVELVLEFMGTRKAGHETCVVDVGAGCGVVAVALAANLPQAGIVATDVSPQALALARRNAERHGVAGRIRFLEGDLLEPLDSPRLPAGRQVDVIAANLPYVRSGDFESGPPEIREHEPRLGLDGGPDGLRIIERLLKQVCLPAGRPRRYLESGGALFIEIGEEQGEAARALAAEVFPQARIEVVRDLSGLDRVLAVGT